MLYITKQSSIVLHSTHLYIMHTNCAKNMCYIAHIQTTICYIAHIQVCTHLVLKTFKICTHLAHSSCLEDIIYSTKAHNLVLHNTYSYNMHLPQSHDLCYIAQNHLVMCYIAQTLSRHSPWSEDMCYKAQDHLDL